MKAIDAIRSAQSNSIRSLVVPEWGDLELFFTKLTIADQEAVEAREPKTPYDRQILMVIHKARDGEGAPLFQMGDAHYLKTEADFLVFQRVVKFMYETAFGLVTSVEDAVEQIEANPSSASV